MQVNEDAANGFFLALELLNSLGIKFEATVLMQRLQEVAVGEITLYNSIEEEIAAAEEKRGQPLSPEDREALADTLSRRKGMDEVHRTTAIQVLQTIGQGPPL